jgi:glycosyltransferase involved in cell wall biosynthesis
MAELTIVIPARNEMFLAKTIEDILANIEGDTEIIACLDGAWANPGIVDNPKVVLVHYSESIGQRAATNQAVKLSKAKYVMKCDAHCAFDKGFDVKMMAEMHNDWTMVPVMKNLHAFDWVCPDGHRRYQGPSGPCQTRLPDEQVCGKETTRDILWQAKPSPNSVSYCFDSAPHFQYFGAYAKRPEGQGEITETMSLQGSCWMLTREKYWELNVCDENFGSWGSQGIEVAVKTWLSGGAVIVNKKTWYAHMFRTQGGDFGFPYPISGSQQEHAKSFARDLFFNNKWDKQVRPFSWLVEKFWPVPGWTDEDLKQLKANTFRFPDKPTETKSMEIEPEESLPRTERYWGEPTEDIPITGIIYPSQTTNTETPKNNSEKGIVYYTDHQLKLKIAYFVQRQLARIADAGDIPIISASLKSMSFGSKNLSFPDLIKDSLADLKLILAGLEESTTKFIFICQKNVLYPPSHFDFTPPERNKLYYNNNVWNLNAVTGMASRSNQKNLVGACAYGETAINYYKNLISNQEKNMKPDQQTEIETWGSEEPIVDIKYDVSPGTINQGEEEFYDIEIPGWGKTKKLIKKFN